MFVAKEWKFLPGIMTRPMCSITFKVIFRLENRVEKTRIFIPGVKRDMDMCLITILGVSNWGKI